MGSPNSGGGGGLTFVHIPQGMPFGLLVHDMVERFLLYFFSMSAHSATRGTWLTPESQSIDRDRGGWPYASPGQANVAMAMKWMLCFEEPETKTLWLGKAVPRDWLAPGEAPLVASNLTTRYGRVSYGIAVSAATAGGGSDAAGYAVTASVTLPASFADAATAPAGGLRLRIRAPAAHAGRLSGVTIGGKAWAGFSAAEETIDIAAGELTPELIRDGLPRIVATFAGPQVPLRPALFDPSRRVVSTALPRSFDAVDQPASSSRGVVGQKDTPRNCPGSMTRVDTFRLELEDGTASAVWAACEDIQQPGGAIALVSCDGEVEWFSKSYEPYGTNASDNKYYLGLGQAAVANSSTDVLGATLLRETALTWAAVEAAVPPIRVSGPGGEWGTNCKGTRTFVGSRGSAYDGTIDDLGHVIPGHDWDGCSWVRALDTIAIQQYNVAVGAPSQAYDTSSSGMGDGAKEKKTSTLSLVWTDCAYFPGCSTSIHTCAVEDDIMRAHVHRAIGC